MCRDYEIVDASSWTADCDEQLGRKPKVWLISDAGDRWLFKYRYQPGDDWAEKVAAEIADLLMIPHATTKLGRLNEEIGVLSLDFTGRGRKAELVLGNNLLVEDDPHYPAGGTYRVAAHTVRKVMDVLGGASQRPPLNAEAVHADCTAQTMFLAYLMLDALIGNTDRHHENWGVLRHLAGSETAEYLAPSFDHAACLGQILMDTDKAKRLETKDRNYTVKAYVRRARSALYMNPEDPRPLSPLDAFRAAGKFCPEASRYWLEILGNLGEDDLLATVRRVPSERISDPSRRFAEAMLMCNRSNLLESDGSNA